MKKSRIIFSFLALIIVSMPLIAQENESEKFEFEVTKKVKTTEIRNQYRSGTCWAFAGLSFIEAELLRMGKPEFDLSDMWIVRHTYEDKADKYVRMHGEVNFAGGGAFHDVFNVWRKYGIVPEEAYEGLNYGEDKHVHGELDVILKGFVDAVIKNGNRKLTPTWKDAYARVLDAYLGDRPEKFEYNGKQYTPKEFADYLGINPDDYINLTSYTHHPFYSEFILEIPDNWAWGSCYNLPLDEFMGIFDHAIEKDFPICWGADVSEKGFSWVKGVAVVPAETRPDLDGLERDKWEKMSAKERNEQLFSLDRPIPEKEITPEIRQEAYDNYQTTDDHGMVIVGTAKDQNGTKYYLVQNSWDTTNIYEGFFYASETYVKYKTMNIELHKDALPKNIKKKLGIK